MHSYTDFIIFIKTKSYTFKRVNAFLYKKCNVDFVFNEQNTNYLYKRHIPLIHFHKILTNKILIIRRYEWKNMSFRIFVSQETSPDRSAKSLSGTVSKDTSLGARRPLHMRFRKLQSNGSPTSFTKVYGRDYLKLHNIDIFSWVQKCYHIFMIRIYLFLCLMFG